MDEVVHDESADTSDAWHGENGLAAGQERPALHEFLIADDSIVSRHLLEATANAARLASRFGGRYVGAAGLAVSAAG